MITIVLNYNKLFTAINIIIDFVSNENNITLIVYFTFSFLNIIKWQDF